MTKSRALDQTRNKLHVAGGQTDALREEMTDLVNSEGT